MTTPTLTPQDVEAFLTEQMNEARKWAKSRRESAETWRDRDEATHEEGRLSAQRMSGRKMPRKSASEREEIAQREEHIAAKLDREAELFAAALSAAERLPRLEAQVEDALNGVAFNADTVRLRDKEIDSLRAQLAASAQERAELVERVGALGRRNNPGLLAAAEAEVERLRLSIRQAERWVKTLESSPRLCDPGCEGRCAICPLDVVVKLRAALTAAPKPEKGGPQ